MRTLESGFKVSYTDHRKAYVPKFSGQEVYRSYLSLMPDDEDEYDETDSKNHTVIAEERKKILAHFEALTGNFT